jgi:hypothetical protein
VGGDDHELGLTGFFRDLLTECRAVFGNAALAAKERFIGAAFIAGSIAARRIDFRTAQTRV